MSAYRATLDRREAIFDALGDGTRRAIVDLLADHPHAVVDLAAALPVTRPAVSLHLKVLRDAGLVLDRTEGTRRIYRLDPDGLDLLRTYLDRMWAQGLASFAAAAEAEHTRSAEHAEPTRSDPPRRGEDDA